MAAPPDSSGSGLDRLDPVTVPASRPVGSIWVSRPAGEAALRDADRIKAEIEARWCALIGPRTFDRLDTALRDLIGLREAALLPKPQGGKKD